MKANHRLLMIILLNFSHSAATGHPFGFDFLGTYILTQAIVIASHGLGCCVHSIAMNSANIWHVYFIDWKDRLEIH